MRPIFRIAKAEFRSLYYSPILWFVCIVFLVQCALVWFKILTGLTDQQDWLIDTYGSKAYFSDEGFPSSLTFSLLGSDPALKSGFIDIAIQCMFLFIPVLTMGVINRERNSFGTFKLLYSSPVKFRQIVLGKYLGLAIFNLVMVAVLFVFFLLTAMYVTSPDLGLMFSIALGFYLLICAYTAIGVFMSALSNYQLLSAIGTFLMLAFLSLVGNYFQRIDFVRDLTWFLSISNRANRMFNGLIVSRDLIYFLAVTGLFLGFALVKLKGAQQSKPWYIKAVQYLAVLCVVLLTGYLSSRPATTMYWDTTAKKLNTIPAEYQQLLKGFGEEPLEVVLYTNLLHVPTIQKGLPENRNSYLADLWDPFLRFKPDIQFRYEYYYNYDSSMDDSALFKSFPDLSVEEIAAHKAKFDYDIDLSRFKIPAQIDSELELKKEGYRLIMQLRYKGKSVFLRTSAGGVWPYQSNVIAALKKLLTGISPSIYYLTGHWERSVLKKGEREYRLHSADKGELGALVNVGYSVDTLSLSTRDIPADARLLVLADPKTEMEPQVVAKLQKYLAEGGNMFILGEPGKQHIVNPLLKPLGIQMKNGQWLAMNKQETADIIFTDAVNMEPMLGKYYNHANWTFLKREVVIKMCGLAELVAADTSNLKSFQLLKNHGPGWHKAAWWESDSIPPVFDAAAGDERVDVIALMGLTRNVQGKEQRVLISGDADFISNFRMNSTKRQPTYIKALYSWLTDFEYPVPIEVAGEIKDNFLDDMDGKKAANLRVVIIWILPALLLLSGTTLLIRRKRK